MKGFRNMKKFNFMITTCIITLIFFVSAWSQVLFVENFDYPVGDTLTNHGWEQIRSGNPITVQEPGLIFDSYELSGIGNAARILADGGQEIKKAFDAVSADSLYISFMINISEATTGTSGGLFLYLTPANGNIFSQRITVYCRKDASDSLAFGIHKGSGIRYTNHTYSLNTTYLIVVKYKFDPQADDPVSMWINPYLDQPEGMPDVIQTSGSDLPEIAEIILSQLTASNEPPDALIDGIKITRHWDEITVSLPLINMPPPASYQLKQNFPNPFNPSTNIRYTIPHAAFVTLKIIDISGRIIQTLVNDFQTAGNYTYLFDGGGLSSGVYFYELTTGDYRDCKRMILLR